MTPSQECGITQKKWTLKELLNYKPFKNINRLMGEHPFFFRTFKIQFKLKITKC